MRVQFYHAIALGALIASSCGRPASNTPAPAPAPATGATATSAPTSSTPTADAIARGREIVERIRAAAGGPKLTALRSIEATGTSTMSVIRGARTLTIRALYPGFYRQEEIPKTGGGLGVAIGIEAEGRGWMLGARLGGAGRGNDAAAQDAYNRAGSQAMAAFLAGVSAPWLMDSGQFTPVASGVVENGDDRNLLIVNIEGPTGRAGRLLVDPGTNLPRRFIEPAQPGPGGEAGRNDLNYTYSDFRGVDGIQLPHTIVRVVGKIQTTWSIGKYTINPKLTPSVFMRRIAARSK